MNNNNAHVNEQHAKRIRLFSQRNRLKVLVFLGVVFLVINGATWAHQGIVRGKDSTRYESGSQNLLQGKPLQDKQVLYPGYIAVVALAQWLGAGPVGVVAIQIALSGVAALALYDLGYRLSGPIAGFLVAGIFVVNPIIAQWNGYILTDSLYISFVIITTWLIHQGGVFKRYWYLVGTLAVLTTVSIRPNGWLFIPVTGIYWAITASYSKSARRISILIVAAIMLATLLVSSGIESSVQAEITYRMLIQGEVVWGYEDWRLPMPSDADTDGAGWAGVIGYALQYPLASMRLAIYRVGACLAHLRPFYSFRHNILAIVFLVPLYLLAIYGLFLARHEQLTILLVSVIGSHLLLVALTFADWDGRFLLYTLPLFGVFSACGAAKINSRWLDLLLGRGIITSK